MKTLLCLACSLMVSLFTSAQLKTIYLFRHAEKEVVLSGDPNMMTSDPGLSEQGKKTAERMGKVVAGDRIAIFTTPYKRTASTAAIIATESTLKNLSGEKAQDEETGSANVSTEVYDPGKPQELVEKLLSGISSVIVVVGHSNTIPALANFFIKENKYKEWPENVYNQYFIITIKDGIAEAKLLNF